MSTFATASDFSDWLNPFVVKEFRQVLRSRLFVGMLLWLQVTMALVCCLPLLTPDPYGRDVSAPWYWLNLALLAHFIMPLRDAFGGNDDMKRENFDLLVVTPNSSSRLMISKWLGTFALTGLCVVSILPYHVLRYFFGGMDVVKELSGLLCLALSSAVYTLWAMFASTFGGAGRAILAALMILAVLFFDLLVAVLNFAPSNTENWTAAATIYLVVAAISFGITSGRFDHDFLRASEVYPGQYQP